MPLYEYITEDGEELEELFKYPPPQFLKSTHGRIAKLRQVSKIADMHDTLSDQCGTKYGPNGYFNRALGCRVYSDREAERIAGSMGFVREDNYAKYHVEDFNEQVANERAEQLANMEEKEAIFSKHGVDTLPKESPQWQRALIEAWEEYDPTWEKLND